MKKNLMIIGGVAIIAVLIAFYGGTKYGQRHNQNEFDKNIWQSQMQQPGGDRQGMRQGSKGNGIANGEIISKDEKSITVKLANGGSKIIFLGGETKVNKMAEATITDLEVGKNIMVTGQTNSDGSITAQNIQLRPEFATSTPNINQ
ncbi:MAG: hypothetical protein PHT51_00690 [Patescibacteria group bacterium]|nr:hypothetical protein [Patescibacteria group bacterium]MDD4611234.1 hypothetical protein [Patescibacteria group bacterium]